MRPRGQGYLNWIVLVVYLASAAVTSRSVVLCREVDGGTAIEFAGDHGQCLRDGACGSETAGVHHADCQGSCAGSCPCEDSSLAVEPALLARKNPPPGEIFGTTADMSPWCAGQHCLDAWPTLPRLNGRVAAGTDVTRRALRTVVLRL